MEADHPPVFHISGPGSRLRTPLISSLMLLDCYSTTFLRWTPLWSHCPPVVLFSSRLCSPHPVTLRVTPSYFLCSSSLIHGCPLNCVSCHHPEVAMVQHSRASLVSSLCSHHLHLITHQNLIHIVCWALGHLILKNFWNLKIRKFSSGSSIFY